MDTFEELFGSEERLRQAVIGAQTVTGWDVPTIVRSFACYRGISEPALNIDAFVYKWLPVVERVLGGGEA